MRYPSVKECIALCKQCKQIVKRDVFTWNKWLSVQCTNTIMQFKDLVILQKQKGDLTSVF